MTGKTTPAPTHKPMTATVTCAHCDWTCKMTGIRVVEMGEALKDALIDHVVASHPEAFQKEPS